jgi:hypothetical protein
MTHISKDSDSTRATSTNLSVLMDTILITPSNTPRTRCNGTTQKSRLYERRRSICIELPPLEPIEPIVTLPDIIPPTQMLSPTTIFPDASNDKKKRKRSRSINSGSNTPNSASTTPVREGTPRPFNSNSSPSNRNLIQLPPMGASPTNTLSVSKVKKRSKSMLAFVPDSNSSYQSPDDDIATTDLIRFLNQIQ